MSINDPVEWSLYDSDLITKLAVLPYLKSSLYIEHQEPGSGTLELPLDSAAAALISSGMFIVCSYRGEARGGFFADNINPVEAESGEHAARILSVSGRGALSILEDAIVWNNSTSSVRSFVNKSKGEIFYTLIQEAQARGALLNVDVDFTTSTSSDSVTWSDREDYDLTVGTSLLEVLRMFAKTGEVEFGVTLQAGATPILISMYASEIGSDKSDTIFFRIGSNCEELSRDERSESVKNALLTKFKNGYILVKDDTSIAARRRRELFLNIEAAQSGGSASTYAAAQLDNQKDPLTSITVKVYDGIKPNVFIDYDLGDTITFDKLGDIESKRVLGIQIDFNDDTPPTVTTELDTIFYDLELRTKNDLNDLLRRWNTAKDANLIEVKEWFSLGNPDGEIYALQYSGGYLYIGGDFDNVGSVAASNVARYNTSTGAWEAMSSGIANPVVALAEHGGDIYAATATTVQHWTGAAWSLIGTTTGTIKTMASFGSNLYVGGLSISFDSGTSFCRVIYWDGSAPWNASYFGLGTSNCLALAVFNGDLYAGFDTSTSGALRRLNGGAWSTVLTTPTDGTNVKALAAVGNDLVYAGGASGTGKVYRWDGASAAREDLFSVTTWGDPGGGSHDALAAYLSDIYYGSDFTNVNGDSGYGNVVRYSGGTFDDLLDGTSTAAGDRINTISVVNNTVFIGGKFTTVGGKSASNLAIYITNFQDLLDYVSNNNAVFDLAGAIRDAAEATVLDNDKFVFWKQAVNNIRSITWSNIKAQLTSLFDTLYAAIGHTHAGTDDVATQILDADNKANFVLADLFGLVDSEDGDTLKNLNGTGMMNSVISHLNSAGYLAPVTTAMNDFQVGDGTGVWIKKTLAQIEKLLTSVSGWIPITDTWTRTGNHTFTTPGDVTSTYKKGTKVRYKDGGSFEYGAIASSSHAAGTTTITLVPNTDYAMAAATITDTAISYSENPDGFPSVFNYTPTGSATGGGSFTVTTLHHAFWRHAGGDFLEVFVRAAGTTAGTVTAITLSLPVDHNAQLTTGVAQLNDGGTIVVARCANSGTGPTVMQIARYDGNNISAGAGRVANGVILYRMS